MVESLAVTSLEAFISQLAPIKSLSPPPLLLQSVVEYFRRSHSTLKWSKVLFSQVVRKPCWWNPTKQKQSGGERRDGAAGLCWWGGSEGAMWWQGPGPDTPSKSGQILWSCLSSMNLACWHTLPPSLSYASRLAVTVFLPFTLLCFKVSLLLRLSRFTAFLINKQPTSLLPQAWGNMFTGKENELEQ